MPTPYGLNIIDNCLACPLREEHLFCHLSPPALQRLNEIKATVLYPKSAMLFIEGQQPRGVFVLCTGESKAFPFFERRKDSHHGNVGRRGCSGLKCRNFEPAVRSDSGNGGARTSQL